MTDDHLAKVSKKLGKVALKNSFELLIHKPEGTAENIFAIFDVVKSVIVAA